MLNDKLENKIIKHAGEVFGQAKEPLAGHRERFEQRLIAHEAEAIDSAESDAPVIIHKNGKVIQLKKALIAAITAAAVIAGFIVLSDSPVEKSQGTELADVRNYYSMQFEDLVDSTKLLIQKIDIEEHKAFLLTNIEQIENEPIPDVQITDNEYIVLIAMVYTNKIEALQIMQNSIRENI